MNSRETPFIAEDVEEDADLFDVDMYTTPELYLLLGFPDNGTDPSDDALEMRILQLIYRYNNEQNNEMSEFLTKVYERFFDLPTEQTIQPEQSEPSEPPTTTTTTIIRPDQKPEWEVIGEQEWDNSNTNPVVIIDYPNGGINPIRKETLEQRITIDSASRARPLLTDSTDFILNLGQTLRGVVKMRLDSFSIPYHWYTISSAYGSNVFYLRGNRPGINTSEHDIKIEILPGTYAPDELCEAVRKSMVALATTYPTIEFGDTDITYSANSSKVDLTFNLRNAYNESHYYVDSSMNDFIYPEDTLYRSTNLWSYLGFNDPIYDLSSVRSNPFITGDPTTQREDKLTFASPPTNSKTFSLIQYVPKQLSTTDATRLGIPIFNPTETETVIDTISFTLPESSYFLPDLINAINDLIRSHPKIDPTYSGVESVYYDKETLHAYKDSYVLHWNFRLNRSTNRSPPFSKLVLKIPNNTGDNIWTSGLQFSPALASVTLPASDTSPGYMLFELNNTRAETKLIAGAYNTNNQIIDGQMVMDTIAYVCTPKSNLLRDDYTSLNQTITLSTATSLSRSQYIANINNALTNLNNTFFNPGTNLAKINSNSKFELQVDIERVFDYTNFKVTVKTTDLLTKIGFAIVEGETELIINANEPIEKTFTNVANIILDDDVTICRVTLTVSGAGIFNPVTISGVELTEVPVKLIHSGAANQNNQHVYTFDALFRQLQISFVQFSWNDKKIFGGVNGTTIALENAGNNELKTKLTLRINVLITEDDYTVTFTGALLTNLHLSNSYDISTVTQKSTFRVIEGNNNVNDDSVTIGDTTIRFTPDAVPGIATSGSYDLVIPANTYTRQDLFAVLNAAFENNAITQGTRINTVAVSGVEEYAEIRWNINKVFMAKDYSLVFYDSERFVSCFIGNKSIRNAKSNSTLGWILGFQAYVEYPLEADAGQIDGVTGFTNYDGSANIYTYNVVSSNTIITPASTPTVYADKVSIRGDVTINVNIYKNFYIIINDYNQNHVNDNVVTIAEPDQQTSLSYANRKFVECDPATRRPIMTGTTRDKQTSLTKNSIYASSKMIEDQNERIGASTNNIKGETIYMSNVFANIPLKIGAFGQTYTENSGTLSNQNRTFFGPINLSRMHVKLMNDRGDTVDLNGQNWSMSIICDVLYQSQTRKSEPNK
jgi:hypothetical protein